MSRSWTDRNITDSTLNSTMKGELLKWLMLLMQLIDITKDDAHTHLKLFVRGRRVAKEFQKEIIDHVSLILILIYSRLLASVIKSCNRVGSDGKYNESY